MFDSDNLKQRRKKMAPVTLPNAKEIPQSHIAQTMNENILLIGSLPPTPHSSIQKDSNELYKLQYKQCLQIGFEIIFAFQCLYSKYIDPNKALFQINISHLIRNALTQSLDTHFYHFNRKKQHIQHQNSNENQNQNQKQKFFICFFY